MLVSYCQEYMKHIAARTRHKRQKGGRCALGGQDKSTQPPCALTPAELDI